MEIRVLGPGDTAALEAFLRPRLASSMFLLNNMRIAGLVDTGERFSGTYVAAFEPEAGGGQAITGVAAHFWNGVLILQAPVHLDALWRAALAATGRPLRGLTGPGDQVAAVKPALTVERRFIQMDHRELLMHLDLEDLVVPEPLETGEVTARRIRPGDVDLLSRWRVDYEVETLSATITPRLHGQIRTTMEQAVEAGDTWVLEADGRPVSTTAFNSRIEEAVQIGGVWTPRSYRSRGYARAVVAASLLAARAEGVEEAILFTDENNLAAQRAYRALGFEQIGDYDLFFLRAPIRL